MNIFSSLFSKEYRHFKKLGLPARKLITSIALNNLATPLLTIFVSAFIYRQSSDIRLVGIYQLGSFLGIPIAFFINGLIIKKIKISTSFLVATVLQALVLIPLFFFLWTGFLKLFLLGLLFGITSGFYWANRNLFTLISTKSENRNYFSGVTAFVGEISSIFIPFIIGWFIVLGEALGLYSSQTAYKILLLIALVILFQAGRIVGSTSTKRLFKGKFPFFRFSHFWNKARLISFGKGLREGGLVIVPTLMVLVLVGEEGALGTFKSISALFSALLVYNVAKRAKIKDRPKVLALGLLFNLLAAVSFGVIYSGVGVVAYFVLSTFSGPLMWVSLDPIFLDAIEFESRDPEIVNRYNNFFDIELFLNSGRIFGAGVFLIFAFTASISTTLRLTPIILALGQLFILPVANSLSKQTERLKNGANEN